VNALTADEIDRELAGRTTEVAAFAAALLELGKDADLLSSGWAASGLPSRRPCDLHAASRVITEYRQMLASKQGRTQ
jgi:hypothetical protein